MTVTRALLVCLLTLAALTLAGCDDDGSSNPTTDTSTTTTGDTSTTSDTSTSGDTTTTAPGDTEDDTDTSLELTGDYLPFPTATGDYHITLEGGGLSYDETGSVLKSDTRFDDQSGANGRWYVYFEAPDASLIMLMPEGDLPGEFDATTLSTTFYISAADADPGLNGALSSGTVHIEIADPTTGQLRARVDGLIDAATTGLAEDVIVKTAFDITAP